MTVISRLLSLDVPGMKMTFVHSVVTAFMGSVVFCVGGYLPVLLDAAFVTAADAETVISHLISLDVARMMSSRIMNLEPQWIVGFVDGKGCFQVGLHKPPTLKKKTSFTQVYSSST